MESTETSNATTGKMDQDFLGLFWKLSESKGQEEAATELIEVLKEKQTATSVSSQFYC